MFGGIDGTVTTFAIVTGVTGAGLSAGVILVLGIANLLADGFSMAASNYSATRSDMEKLDHLVREEQNHIRLHRRGEEEELSQILAGYGYAGPQLDRALASIQESPALWIELMLKGEYGVASIRQSPARAALATWVAFVVCGAVPLLPFLIQAENALTLATVVTGIVFFLVGAIKTRWTQRSWWISGLETLAIGALAAAIAYGCGALLSEIVPDSVA